MVLLVLFIFCLLQLFFFAFPNKEKGGVLTCDRLLYTQINQLSCLFWQRFTFFEGFSGVIFFCLTTKLQHESSSTLAPVIFATLNYLDYYHETSKQLSLWDLVCYCLLLIFPRKMSTVEVWFWLRWLKKLYLLIIPYWIFLILPVLFLLIAKSILHWASLLVWCNFFVDFVSNSFLFWVTYFYPIWVRGGGICFLMLLNEISLCSAFFYPTLPFQRRAIFLQIATFLEPRCFFQF